MRRRRFRLCDRQLDAFARLRACVRAVVCWRGWYLRGGSAVSVWVTTMSKLSDRLQIDLNQRTEHTHTVHALTVYAFVTPKLSASVCLHYDTCDVNRDDNTNVVAADGDERYVSSVDENDEHSPTAARLAP